MRDGAVPDCARFCRRCGSAVTIVCAACNNPNPADSAFCESCGARIEAGAPPAEGTSVIGTDQRRQVTVVFADISGFTALAETLDPEDTRDVAERTLLAMATAIESCGGAIDKSLGDGLMAVFGAPVAHDDDPVRALRAAVAARDAARDAGADWDLDCSIGVNTGTALAGAMTGDDYTVIGDVVNLAARLQQAAPTGEIYVGDHTRDLVGDIAGFEPLDPLMLKGKAASVTAWRLVGVGDGSRPPVSVETPFVGREAELAALVSAAEDALSTSTPARGVVWGGAGIGKSRLVGEAVARLRESHDDLLVLEASCPPYGDVMVFEPLVTILRRWAGLDVTATPAEIVARLATMLSPHLGEGTEIVVRQLATVLDPAAVGQSDISTSAREMVFWAVAHTLQALARATPTVIVIDDLQWAGPSQHDLAEYIVAHVTEAKLVLFATARLELADRRPTWVDPAGRQVAIELGPLPAADEAKLAASLMGAGDIDDDLAREISERSGGVPFFTEELVRSLSASGALTDVDGRTALLEGGSVTVPRNLEGLLTSLLDSLPATDRALVQAASVAGMTVRPGDAAVLLGEDPAAVAGRLENLASLGLLVADEDEDGFRFRHGLLRDVAYETLRRAARARAHTTLARTLEQSSPGADTRNDDLMTFHLESAALLERERVVPGDDAGEIIEAAARNLVAAGSRAWRRGAWAEADALNRRALAILAEVLDDSELTVGAHMGLARALICEGDEAGAHEHLDLARQAADHPRLVGAVELELAKHARLHGEIADAVAHANASLRHFVEAEDACESAHAEAILSIMVFLSGETERAIDIARSAAAAAQAAGHRAAESIALQTIAMAATFANTTMLQSDEAVAAGQRGLELARELGDHEAIITSLESLATASIGAGMMQDAYDWAIEGYETARDLGVPHEGVISLTIAAMTPFASEEMLDLTLETSEATGNKWAEGLVRVGRSDNRARKGDREGAFAEAVRATELLDEVGDQARLAWALRSRSFAALHTCRREDARASLARARELARSSGEHRLELLLEMQSILLVATFAEELPPGVTDRLDMWTSLPSEWCGHVYAAEVYLLLGDTEAAGRTLDGQPPSPPGSSFWTWDHAVRARVDHHRTGVPAHDRLVALAAEDETPPLLAASWLLKASTTSGPDDAPRHRKAAEELLAAAGADFTLDELSPHL